VPTAPPPRLCYACAAPQAEHLPHPLRLYAHHLPTASGTTRCLNTPLNAASHSTSTRPPHAYHCTPFTNAPSWRLGALQCVKYRAPEELLALVVPLHIRFGYAFAVLRIICALAHRLHICLTPLRHNLVAYGARTAPTRPTTVAHRFADGALHTHSPHHLTARAGWFRMDFTGGRRGRAATSKTYYG